MGYANRGGPRTKGPHDQCHGDRCLHRQAHRPIWWHGGPSHRRLRAVGDPAQRLSEDGLRILRAYRFMDAGPHRMVPDEGLRHALATHADMLDRISKERIWTEFRRILSGIDPSGTLHRMQVDGALGHVLPECILDVDALMHLGDGPSDALLRLTVLTWRTPVDHLRSVLKALTLSNAQLAVPLRLRKGIAMSLPSNQGERRRHRVLLGEDLDAVMRVRARPSTGSRRMIGEATRSLARNL